MKVYSPWILQPNLPINQVNGLQAAVDSTLAFKYTELPLYGRASRYVQGASSNYAAVVNSTAQGTNLVSTMVVGRLGQSGTTYLYQCFYGFYWTQSLQNAQPIAAEFVFLSAEQPYFVGAAPWNLRVYLGLWDETGVGDVSSARYYNPSTISTVAATNPNPRGRGLLVGEAAALGNSAEPYPYYNGYFTTHVVPMQEDKLQYLAYDFASGSAGVIQIGLFSSRNFTESTAPTTNEYLRYITGAYLRLWYL